MSALTKYIPRFSIPEPQEDLIDVTDYRHGDDTIPSYYMRKLGHHEFCPIWSHELQREFKRRLILALLELTNAGGQKLKRVPSIETHYKAAPSLPTPKKVTK